MNWIRWILVLLVVGALATGVSLQPAQAANQTYGLAMCQDQTVNTDDLTCDVADAAHNGNDGDPDSYGDGLGFDSGFFGNFGSTTAPVNSQVEDPTNEWYDILMLIWVELFMAP